MCGIAGIFHAERSATADIAGLTRVRDRMSHRGPDGAGLWSAPGAALAHRRLAVVDTTPAGAQPMLWCRDPRSGRARAKPCPDGRGIEGAVELALVYNGELYNDSELREQLAGEGVEFHSRSDTETVLAALATWGFEAVDRLRGMYALGCVDLKEHRLLLARDPLGIKPLYFASIDQGGESGLLFASEIPAIGEHPGITLRPDPVVVSSYLTTIRTTLGERTLMDGVRTLEPGQRLLAERRAGGLELSRRVWWDSVGARAAARDDRAIRDAVEDSVVRHLRSDVPVCCLLSGGLDSSIIARVARDRSAEPMTTFCAGADRASGGSDDFEFSRQMAGVLDSRHIEAPVSRGMFRERWESMVRRSGVPLSTPNEVAINEVARRLHAEGFIVALSGEGADELFGGYDALMTPCAAEGSAPGWRARGGRLHLDLTAWVPLDAKDTILSPEMMLACRSDALLAAEYDRVFAQSATGIPDDQPLQAHLRFQRRVNLAGLLLRLDQASMLESVEGRTPLADQEIALLAESLPMDRKFAPAGSDHAGSKIALRSAFSHRLPPEIVRRPKASFPLPFQEWMEDAVDLLKGPAAGEWFTEAAIAAVCSQPRIMWNFGWPMINLAIWAARWS